MDRKKKHFTISQKIYLIRCIKKHPIIWDRSHPKRKQRRLLKLAWEKVARNMNINDDTICRMAWRSICDSRRYYKKKENNSITNGSLNEGDGSSDDNFAKYMPIKDELSFLDENEANAAGELESFEKYEMLGDESISQYSYRSNSPTSTTHHSILINEPICDVEEIFDYPEENIEHDEYAMITAIKKDIHNDSNVRRKSPIKKRNNSINVSHDPNHSLTKKYKPSESGNESFLNHLDSILLKLPIKTSESLQARIMAMAYGELEQMRDS
ncbi:uncharacterized protein LOC142224121 [Haematobia irritans]|uniref:uncharacterized protein LOC142224121 n=1 Tax=Haematobia irritans TaxID=7368 RepID=UPI003F500D51